jgi:hypothetical protein
MSPFECPIKSVRSLPRKATHGSRHPNLVFGEWRLKAYKDILKRKTILARIVNAQSIVEGEHTENEIKIALKRNCNSVTSKFCGYQHVRLYEVRTHDVQHRGSLSY